VRSNARTKPEGIVVIKNATAAALMFILAGCSQTIDGSDRDAYRASVEAITAEMDTAETLKFVTAAATACPLTLQAGQPTFVDDSCLPVLDGKTVEEVNKMAQVNRLKLRLKTAEAMLEIYQGRYEHTPANPKQVARFSDEVAEINAELESLGESYTAPSAPEPVVETTSGAPSSSDSAESPACEEGTNGVPALGSDYEDGVYLCREPAETYWNDWYVVLPTPGQTGFQIKSQGKTSSFSGNLTIDCESGQTSWADASNFDEPLGSEQEVFELVPSQVVANAKRQFCKASV
jgi:hypothetical protein